MIDTSPLRNVRCVLVRPSHPGNIGAAARALKTMGLSRLYLVEPERFPDPDADARASGALDVLRAATLCADIDEALAGTEFACALSARRRDLTPEVTDAHEAAAEVIDWARRAEVAVVFGPEDAGLGIAAVSRCQRLVRIPANPDYPSLNLAAAVQIVAYELRRACSGRVAPDVQGTHLRPAPHEDVEGMIAHLEHTMRATGFLDPARPGRLIQRMRRMFARARPEPEELAILRGFLRSVGERREH